MKKIICGILCAALIFANTTVYAGIPKFRYSFEEAAKMAIENAPNYRGMDSTIDKASDAYEVQEKVTPKEIKYTGNFKTFVNRQVGPQLKLENAYTDYQSAVLSKENIKRDIILNLRRTVIGVQKAEMAYSETDIGKRNKQNELELLEIRYENGLISKNDYNDSKRKIKDALKAFDVDGEKAVNMAYRQLNTLLGREDEKDIEVKLDDTVIPLDKLNLEQIKKDMIKKDQTLSGLSEQKRLADYNYGLIKERYDKYELDKFTDTMRSDMEEMYEEAKRDYEVADKAYENAIDRFEKSFNDMIEDIEDLYEDIEDAKEKIAEEKENRSLYDLKYESGRMSKLEYDALGDKITLLEHELKKLELDLNMKYAELLIYSDLKKVVKE